MDALRADCGDAIVLVTPAFPETGRTIYQGNLFVGSMPLNESPLKDHPLNPMHDFNLVRVLTRRSKPGLRWSISPTSRAGRMPSARGLPVSPAKVLVPPSRMRCSNAISKPSARSRWIIGCPSARSGLGLGIARALVASRRLKSSAPNAITDAPVGGPAACLAGSCSQATLQQIASAEF